MYEIILLDRNTGHALNENGEIHTKGSKDFRPTFETEKEAFTEKDRLLNLYVYSAVIIRNLTTNESSQEYYNVELLTKYNLEKQIYIQWLELPFYKRIFKQKPILKYFDEKR